MLKFTRSLFKHYRVFVPAALLFFATSVYFLLRSDIFLLRELKIHKQTDHRLISEAQLSEQLSSYIARSLLTLNTKSLQTALVEGNLTLRLVEVNKRLPETLEVRYWEREPVAVVEMGENFLLVDSEGLIFHPASERYKLSLSHLILSSDGDSEDQTNYQLGDRFASGLVTAALQILDGVNQMAEVELAKLEIHPQGTFTLQTENGWTALLDAGKDVPAQITSLQTVVTAARMEGRGLQSIDLRFERPVVVYE